MRPTRLALLASLATYSNAEPQAIVDTARPLVPMKDYVPPSDLDNNPNYFYPSDYRILNCWECFEAQGKMCLDQAHKSLYHHTGSSDTGNAFCCKPGSNEGYCKSGNAHGDGAETGITTVCSEPSSGASSKFSDILTSTRNHQMFAFCPTTNRQRCGVAAGTGVSTDMGLKAGLSKQEVVASDMNYFKPHPSNGFTFEYDACYYEVTLDESVLDKYDPQKLHIQISRKSDVNVYIYAGRSRLEATESVTSGNSQATLGASYSVGAQKGFLIVAYANEGAVGDFGFNYWLEAELKPDTTTAVLVNEQEETVIIGEEVATVAGGEKFLESELRSTNPLFAGEQGDMLFIGLCAGAGVLLITIVIICWKCRSQRGKIKTADSKVDASLAVHEKSLHLEDVLEDDYKGQNDTNRPSLPKGQERVFDDAEKVPPMAATYKTGDEATEGA